MATTAILQLTALLLSTWPSRLLRSVCAPIFSAAQAWCYLSNLLLLVHVCAVHDADTVDASIISADIRADTVLSVAMPLLQLVAIFCALYDC